MRGITGRLRGVLMLAMVVGGVLATATATAAAESPVAHAADRDCSDFDSQAEAQRYFRARGGPGSDPDRLDSDGDGRACDSLPCPCGSGGSPRSRPKPRRPDFSARIVRVIDGDTIVVRSGSGRRSKVRLIGIDTPEVFGGLECGGRQASASMKRLAPPGRRVRVYGDPTQDRRDRYGRLLAYVKMRSGPQLNIAQVRRGWAKVYVFQGRPFRQTASFRRAARAAKGARRGAWGRCDGNFHRPGTSRANGKAAACGSVSYGGRGYVLYYRGMGCATARRRVRHVHRHRGLRGWRCSSGTNFRTGGYCKRGRHQFGWHPGD